MEMGIKQKQVLVEKYLSKYLASHSLQTELVISTHQLLTLNQIMVEKIIKKK